MKPHSVSEWLKSAERHPEYRCFDIINCSLCPFYDRCRHFYTHGKTMMSQRSEMDYQEYIAKKLQDLYKD